MHAGKDEKVLNYTVFLIRCDPTFINIIQEVYEKSKENIPLEITKRAVIEKQFGSVIEIPILDDSPYYSEILSICLNHAVNFRRFHRVYYTKREKERIPFFQVTVSAPFELEGTRSASYGTQHEIICAECGLEGSTKGDVLVDGSFIRKTKIGLITPEYIVCEQIKNQIEEIGLTGVTFTSNIRDWRDRAMEPFYLMHINELPPLSTSTWICSVHPHKGCGHMTNYLQSELIYEENSLLKAKDFNVTKERLDNWNTQYLVLSARAKELLRANKVRATSTPIRIIPEGEKTSVRPPISTLFNY